MHFRRAVASFVLGIALSVVLFPQICEAKTVPLVLRQTPFSGGQMDPEPGVHYFEPGTEITLSASPRKGYRFLRWLGPVADPTAATTVVYLDQPKIVIAVFHATKFTLDDDELEPATKGSGSSRGAITRQSVYAGGGGSGISYTYVPPDQYVTYVIIPEPGTLILVGLSAAMLRNRRLRGVRRTRTV